MKFENKHVYDNIRVLSPGGQLMCYVGKKKAQWYIKRRLASWCDNNSGIKLKFEPRGLGHYHDPERNVPVENKCVVCGNNTIAELSRHHTIPECFRKYFPHRWKSYRSHDIVVMCIDCHQEYEIDATNLKQQLINNMVDPEELRKERYMVRCANTLLKHSKKLPVKERDEITLYLMLELNLDDITDEVLHEIIKKPKINIYQRYSETIKDYKEFSRFWKQHFIDVMKPKYLPPYWTPDYEPSYLEEKFVEENAPCLRE